MSLFDTVDFSGQKFDTVYTDHEPDNNPNGPVFFFSGTFQPAKGNQTEVLKASLRSSDTFRVYTEEILIIEGSKTNSYHHIINLDTPDIVYKIVYAFPWKNLVLENNKYLVQELKEPDDG